MIVAWLAFPAILAGVCLGCGLLVEALAGRRLPGALLPASGLALITVAGQFLTLGDATAGLAAPAAPVAAVAGFALALARRRALQPPAALVLALGVVFAVYAAPIVASGATTVAGYIKLDDTATWLAFTDRIMEHGRDLSGLADSTYRRTLEVNIGEGYPIGAFIPFGVGVELLGVDPAWLIQPYMAFLALLFALAAWELLRPLVEPAWTRAAIVAVASQPALLYGYYLWGGVKEIAAAALVATAAALAAFALGGECGSRSLIPLLVATGGVIGVLSPAGLVWLLPILLGAAIVLGARVGLPAAFRRALEFGLGLALLSIPVLAPGGLEPPTSSPLSDPAAKGNLIRPLDPLQVAGVWPTGDFRLPASHVLATDLLVAVVLALAAAGIWWTWRRRALGTLGLAACGALGCATLVALGSPWVGAKAMATVSPFVLLAAGAGAVAVGRWTRPAAGIVLAAVVVAGVGWSNALAYGGASLAPHDQFAELADIAGVISGDGPTLMTEYSPYGARHFLREADPESVSELRYRPIPLRSGRQVEKGLSADTDALDPSALSVYRTLVLRRSPTGSRPPGAYRLLWSGRFYDAWQRPEGATRLAERLPLGSRYDAVGVPRCADVQALARRSPGGLIAATGASPIAVALDATDFPDGWANPATPSAPIPDGAGSITADVGVERPGSYEVWLGGSIRPEADLFVDGEKAGEVRHELNNYGQFAALGSASLDAGKHQIELRFHGPDLHPGSAGVAAPVGPLVLTTAEADESRLVRVGAGEVRKLCGREWDWIEAAG